MNAAYNFDVERICFLSSKIKKRSEDGYIYIYIYIYVYKNRLGMADAKSESDELANGTLFVVATKSIRLKPDVVKSFETFSKHRRTVSAIEFLPSTVQCVLYTRARIELSTRRIVRVLLEKFKDRRMIQTYSVQALYNTVYDFRECRVRIPCDTFTCRLGFSPVDSTMRNHYAEFVHGTSTTEYWRDLSNKFAALKRNDGFGWRVSPSANVRMDRRRPVLLMNRSRDEYV